MRNIVCMMLMGLFAAVLPAHAAVFSSDFSGTSPWNFDTLDDPSNLLWGAGEMIYSGTVNNVKAWVTKSIDGATVFPLETGVLTLKMKIDLSNYPTTNSDFAGPALIEIATAGNKSSFTGGKLYTFNAAGFNTPGEYRFGQSIAWIYWNSGAGNANTGSRNIGNRPAFPLVYDMLATIYISGNDTDGWTIHAKTDVTGPINNLGVIGTDSMSSTYTYVSASINGLKSITGLRVGCTRGSLAPGNNDSVVLDDVDLTLVPEPAIIGLLGLGVLAFLRRRR